MNTHHEIPIYPPSIPIDVEHVERIHSRDNRFTYRYSVSQMISFEVLGEVLVHVCRDGSKQAAAPFNTTHRDPTEYTHIDCIDVPMSCAWMLALLSDDPPTNARGCSGGDRVASNPSSTAK